MYSVLLVIYLLAALGVIGLVLIQQGKGADMGASFGAGASSTVFGSGGSGNFLTRMTAVCATLFFIISLALGNLSTKTEESSWMDPTQGQVIEQAVEFNVDVPAAENSDIPQ
ncbi:MAG: preprotein translocase subunit SecG [Aliivibrio sp.]|uniref:preprotein translocase subunit SecG n=1 Tax=Aliivibrio sp. TaxID=1872443 RepID=UPI001A5F1721|nr:preprotein translocase subunit SecG [Aliivibrio sp.]